MAEIVARSLFERECYLQGIPTSLALIWSYLRFLRAGAHCSATRYALRCRLFAFVRFLPRTLYWCMRASHAKKAETQCFTASRWLRVNFVTTTHLYCLYARCWNIVNRGSISLSLLSSLRWHRYANVTVSCWWRRVHKSQVKPSLKDTPTNPSSRGTCSWKRG